jgi:hypothetical protein
LPPTAGNVPLGVGAHAGPDGRGLVISHLDTGAGGRILAYNVEQEAKEAEFLAAGRAEKLHKIELGDVIIRSAAVTMSAELVELARYSEGALPLVIHRYQKFRMLMVRTEAGQKLGIEVRKAGPRFDGGEGLIVEGVSNRAADLVCKWNMHHLARLCPTDVIVSLNGQSNTEEMIREAVSGSSVCIVDVMRNARYRQEIGDLVVPSHR